MVENYQTLVVKLKKRLTSFDTKDDDILPIIKNLNVDKVDGWDQLSIRMIKACGNSISSHCSLSLPKDWKKINVVPIHKKNQKI